MPKTKPEEITHTYIHQGGRHFTISSQCLDSLRKYRDTGRPTGGFLRAILANDFVAAIGRADIWNVGAMPAFADYLYNHMPLSCWGSYEKVDAWIAQKGKK